MKKIIYAAFFTFMFIALAGCGEIIKTNEASGTTTYEEKAKLTDEDFVKNLSKALEARWEIASMEEYSDDKLESMSISEFQKASELFVDSELEEIGEIENYEFNDKKIEEIANTYIKALRLQKEGVKYRGTDEYLLLDQTWSLGYYYRAICINELYKSYELSIKEKYQKTLDDFIAESDYANKFVSFQEFVDDVSEKIEYTKDDEKSDEWSTYYTALVENTTEYIIDGIDIEISFIDSDGVIVYQTTDYLQNIKPGAKVKSTVYYDTSCGDFEKTECNISCYYE